MPQGKMKVKAKLPQNVKAKKGNEKGKAVTKRANCPSKMKKDGIDQVRKLKKIVTKNVNKAIEAEVREMMANENKVNLSRAQQAVADHHKKHNSTGPS